MWERISVPLSGVTAHASCSTHAHEKLECTEKSSKCLVVCSTHARTWVKRSETFFNRIQDTT